MLECLVGLVDPDGWLFRLLNAGHEPSLWPGVDSASESGVSHAHCTSAVLVQPNVRKRSQTREPTTVGSEFPWHPAHSTSWDSGLVRRPARPGLSHEPLHFLAGCLTLIPGRLVSRNASIPTRLSSSGLVYRPAAPPDE
jgi:hypothetical protein